VIWMIDSVVRDLHKDGVKSPMRGEAQCDDPIAKFLVGCRNGGLSQWRVKSKRRERRRTQYSIPRPHDLLGLLQRPYHVRSLAVAQRLTPREQLTLRRSPSIRLDSPHVRAGAGKNATPTVAGYLPW